MTCTPGGSGVTAPNNINNVNNRTRPIMVPCPTHTHGHPIIVLTQFSTIAHNRHQNQLQSSNQDYGSHSAEQLQPSPQISSSSSNRGPQQQISSRGLDRAFDDELWKLIPHSMRLHPSSKCPSPLPPSSLARRPSLSDTIDNSGTRFLVSKALNNGIL